MYTARLASRLQATGRWKVEVVTGRLRPGEAQNSVETTSEDGITVHGIVQNYPYRGLPEAIDDAALDRVFDGIVCSFAPDLIAVQSLVGLSLGFFEVGRAAGIPTVLHLHDGWWSCPSGGQRLHPEGSLCLPVRPERCATCFSSYQHREGPLERGARALAGRLPSALPPNTLHRAFENLPGRSKGLLRRINERAARLRAWQSQGSSETVGERLEPEIERRQKRINEIVKGVSLVISPTEFLADSLRDDGLVFPELTVESTGVPAAPSRKRQASGDRVRILFVGTWVTHKGPQVLARALAAMPEALFENGAVEALAIGPAPFPAFQQEVIELAQGRLQLRAALPPHEVPSALADGDLLVVPSLWAENAPLIVLESLAAGTPVVASQLGGLPELLRKNGGGLLFEAGNHQALAAVLTELVESPNHLHDLTDNVRTPRALSDFAAAIEQHYEEICAKQDVRATGT